MSARFIPTMPTTDTAHRKPGVPKNNNNNNNNNINNTDSITIII